MRHLLLQTGSVIQLWSSSDDKTVKVWAVSDDVCGVGTPSSILTISLPCVALVCETVEVVAAAAHEDESRSVWMGCDDHVIRVWSCKRQLLFAELKHHKVCVCERERVCVCVCVCVCV